MSDVKSDVRAWLRQVLDQSGMTPYALSKAADIPQSTLSKVLNDENYKATLSFRTIARITQATGLSGPGGEIGPSSRAIIVRDDQDAMPFDGQSGDARTDNAVRYLCEADPNLSAWRLTSRVLEALSYQPGDILVVDQSCQPASGDIVCAQLYRARGADTVFRHYVKPFLMAAAMDGVPRPPVVVDDMAARIAGVVIGAYRPRRVH